jgi:WD40 repeat protein
MEADAAAQEVSSRPFADQSLIARSHLDAVQAVAFGPEATVVSGSWDCTVKVWRLANDKSGNR